MNSDAKIQIGWDNTSLNASAARVIAAVEALIERAYRAELALERAELILIALSP